MTFSVDAGLVGYLQESSGGVCLTHLARGTVDVPISRPSTSRALSFSGGGGGRGNACQVLEIAHSRIVMAFNVV